MIKGQDIVLLVHLLAAAPEWTVRDLADDLGLGVGPIHRSLGRLAEAGLYDAHRKRVVRSAAAEFLVYGLRYVFPAQLRGEVRGRPAAWAASPLRELLADDHPLPPVWPASDGEVRGLALEPLHVSALRAAQADRVTGERLALLDALRAGDARIRGLAAEHLQASIDASARGSA